MNRASYIWVLELTEILKPKIQIKLLKLAKDLNISEWDMYINLETLPDVRYRIFINKSYIFEIKVFYLIENSLDQNARRTATIFKTTRG